MNVNRGNTGDFYRNRSNANGPSTLAAAVSDLSQQHRLLGGPAPFNVSDCITALAAGGVGARNTDGGAAATAAAAALSSLGKIGGGTTNGLLKSALHSDGKFPTPIVGLQGQPMKTFGSSAITDTTAIAAVFPPVAKPPAFVTIAAKTTDAATTAAAASVNPDEFKKQQRLEQNKMSARRSRRRKKIILEELQATVDHLTAENEQLDAENKRLEKELERRKKEAIRMKDNANGGGLVAAVPPSSLGTGLSTSGGTDMSKATIGYSAVPAIVVPANSIANRSLLVSRLSTIMNGQAAPGLCARSQTLGAPTATTGTLPNLAAASNISSIATPAPRPSQLYLSRPTSDAKNTSSSSSSSAATAQEQLQRSILSLYQEQERKNTNKKRRLRK